MKRKIIILLCCLVIIACKKEQEVVSPKLPSYFNSKIKKGMSKDSLGFYFKQLKKISKNNLSDSLNAEFHYVTGRYNIRLKKYDSAISNFNKATSFSKKRIKDNREVLFFRALMDTYYSFKNDYLNGEGVNEKLHSLLDEKDYKNRAYVYGFRENVKAALNQFEEALIANDSAATMYLRAGDTINYTMSKISRSSIYSSLGNQEKAIKELFEARKYEESLKNTGKYQLYGTLGFYLFYNKSYNKAIQAYRKSLSISKKLPSSLAKTRVINNYINLSSTYMKLNKYGLAKKYVDSIFQLGLNNIDYINQKDALKINLEIAYKRNEKIEELMIQLDSIFSYQEKSYSDKINKELNALKESYKNEIVLEKAKRKAEIQSLTLERNQYILILLLLMVLIIGVLFLNFYRQKKFKIEQQNFLLHQRLLRSQMNPHFTFNSLSLIKNNIEEDTEKSIKYIQKFSRLLRAIFENSTKNYVPIEDELESLQDYIELQQFRFPKRFNYIINNSIDTEEEILIPPMLLQPFVENAIIHGFRKKESIGNLSIELSFNEKYVCCVIDDDGIGIDENNVGKKSSVKLIDDFLKKMTGEGVVVINKKEVEKESRETGTKVELKIPYNIF